MKLEHFENVKNVCEKRRNFQNLMVAKGLIIHLVSRFKIRFLFFDMHIYSSHPDIKFRLLFTGSNFLSIQHTEEIPDCGLFTDSRFAIPHF